MAKARTLACCAALFWAAPALADDCTVRVNGIEVAVTADLYTSHGGATWREGLLASPRDTFSWLRGDLPACPSDVTLNFIAAIEGLPNPDGYCLAEGDPQTGWLLVPGTRNFRGRCAVSTCQRLSMAADDIVGLTDSMAALVLNPPDADSTVMQHPSGVIIVTAAQSWLQEVVTAAGATAIGAIIASPVGATASAVTLMAVGGTVWVCS